MIESDPFAASRIGNKSQRQSFVQENTQQPQQEQEDPFAAARIKKVEGFPMLYEGGRHIARTASRVAETIGGIPGDVEDFIQSGIFAGLDKITGQNLSQELSKEQKKQAHLPTTHELQEFSEEKTGG